MTNNSQQNIPIRISQGNVLRFLEDNNVLEDTSEKLRESIQKSHYKTVFYDGVVDVVFVLDIPADRSMMTDTDKDCYEFWVNLIRSKTHKISPSRMSKPDMLYERKRV